MIEINDKQAELKRAAKSSDGKFILDFIRQEVERTFDYAIIDIEGKDEDVGRDFKTTKTIKDFFQTIDNILTSEQER